MKMVHDLVISDEDIDWVEKLMGEGISFDDERRDIIKNLESKDVQAFPGSGKTTVLVAKLAILANKWDSANSGICVLSHTNVAREEIENRLGNTDIGAKLLNYPHFIGTVHSFFTTYIALPWLKSQGKHIEIIETEFVTKYRWNKIPRNFKYTLTKRNLSEVSCCLINGELKLGGINENTATFKQVFQAINDSQDEGYFTFDEILFIAKKVLEDSPILSSISCQRFPIVFLDEAQDTNEFQYQMINKCFAESNQQGFGDENQAIYNYIGEESSGVFPRKNPLILSRSKRFSNNVAKLANPLAVSESSMVGENDEFQSNKHTIFLFEKDKINDVLSAYARLLLETYTDEELEKYRKEGCYAVGLVHNKREETKLQHLPKGVFDYWPNYKSKPINKGYTPKYLVEYFRYGQQQLVDTNNTYGQINQIMLGIERILRKNRPDIQIKSKNNLMRAYSEYLQEESKRKAFRENMFVLQNCKVDSKESWIKCVDTINNMLDLFETDLTKDDFIMWIDESYDIQTEKSNKSEINGHNVFRYDNGSRSVDINLSSIHGVKGKTHMSTLVLETFLNSHRIKNIIPFVCGQGKKRDLIKKGKNLKCHYVAMTRPRGLLCLAIPTDEVEEKDIYQLQKIGWNISYV